MSYEYWISFRVEDRTVNGRSPNERYVALNAAIKKAAILAWSETTSFYLIESESTTASLASALRKAIAPAYDMLLIRRVAARDAVYIGPTPKLELQLLMPYVKI